MWAPHTAFIEVRSITIGSAQGDARLLAAVVSKLAPVGGRSPQYAGEQITVMSSNNFGEMDVYMHIRVVPTAR